LFFQVIGIEILPFTPQTGILLFGFFLVVVGFLFSMLGRHSLGTNWAHALEYQIKKKQELVTRGIYRFIRHPIYSGFFLSILGLELVLGSYLSIVVLLIGIPVLNRQAGMEEKLLEEHFGKKYGAYKERTTRFIPLLW
ncbi:MAG TPA: isoprenylcysteine carboxylmethyltransferase family protein, partial [Patescibacteria group bacterium]|nr:isoprenylcysteine carboxylmethyltransferase family protein [Patescibacteria group bacterium]